MVEFTPTERFWTEREGHRSPMTIRLNTPPAIENLRSYPAEIVEGLRWLLMTGAAAHADLHRANFYDVVDGARVYFIHISPAPHKVMLLATWLDENPASPRLLHLQASNPHAPEFRRDEAHHHFSG